MKKKVLSIVVLVAVLSALLLLSSCGGGDDNCHHDLIDGECDLCGAKASEGLEFEYNSADDNYSLVGIGDCEDDVVLVPDKHRGRPVVSIKEFSDADICKIYLPETLTSISSECFMENTSITEVYTRNTESIGADAFKGCTSLTKIDLDVTVIYPNAFEGCTALKAVTLTNRIKRIASEAFLDCDAIDEFNLEKLDKGEVVCIEQDAFKNSGIYEIESLWSDGALYIGTILVSVDPSVEVLTLQENTTSFAMDAFVGCRKLHTIKVDLSDEYQDEWAFSNRVSFEDCSLLKRIEFLDGVTSVPTNMFFNCKTVSEVVLPETLKTIQSYSFKGCTSLTKIKLPKNLTKIANDAFSSTGVTFLVLPESVEDLGVLYNIQLFSEASVYPSSYYENERIYLVGEWSYIDGVPTPNNDATQLRYTYLKESDSYKVSGVWDDELTEVVIPSRYAGKPVTCIGNKAFRFRDSFSEVTIYDGVTEIGYEAFWSCGELTQITVPKSVIKIGEGAFEYCYSLATINYEGTVAEWNAIEKFEDSFYGSYYSIRVICTDGEVEL